MKLSTLNKLTECVMAVVIGLSIGIIIVLLLSGCAAKKPIHIDPTTISKIRYRPQDCHPLPNGNIECNHVEFVIWRLDIHDQK